MVVLIIFAFLSGIVTVLSPCILPLLPIILSGSLDQSEKYRPYGIILGFVTSFTFFTLFLSTLVKFFGIPANSMRTVSVFIIALFGLSLLIPRFQLIMETVFSRLLGNISTTRRPGFSGGIILGLSIGLLWTPCVGPILASVITLALTSSVTLDAFFITLAYSLGTAIPMYLIIKGGSNTFARNPRFLKHTQSIQRGFGLVMLIVAVLIYFGIDRSFQAYILSTFPNYFEWLTMLEDNDLIKSLLP